jgi:hypothetical protein
VAREPRPRGDVGRRLRRVRGEARALARRRRPRA